MLSLFSLGRRDKVDSCQTHRRNYYPHPATRYLRHHRFPISLDFRPSWEENPAKLSTDALPFRKSRTYQPPPLRGRSVFDDEKLLLIDPYQLTCKARANVFRSHGIGVDATDSLQVARTYPAFMPCSATNQNCLPIRPSPTGVRRDFLPLRPVASSNAHPGSGKPIASASLIGGLSKNF